MKHSYVYSRQIHRYKILIFHGSVCPSVAEEIKLLVAVSVLPDMCAEVVSSIAVTCWAGASREHAQHLLPGHLHPFSTGLASISSRGICQLTVREAKVVR